MTDIVDKERESQRLLSLLKNRIIGLQKTSDKEVDLRPRRVSLDEAREILISNLQAINDMIPLFSEALKNGAETLKNEGVDEFENKSLPQIRQIESALKVNVDRIVTLPALFGFVESELQEELDNFLSEIAEEFGVDKVLIAFIESNRYDFSYTYGFTEEELLDFYRNRDDIEDKEIVEGCNIYSMLVAMPAYNFWSENDMKYIRIFAGRSQEMLSQRGILTEQDRELVNRKLEKLIEREDACWVPIREYLLQQGYKSFDDVMLFLRHNGEVNNVFKLKVFSFLEDIRLNLEKIRSGGEEGQESFKGIIFDLRELAEDEENYNRIISKNQTFLQLFENGKNFKTRNVTPHLNERILSFSEEAESKGLEYIVDLTDEDLFVQNCDLNLLDIMIDNLIQNAIKYTPEGRIVVRVTKRSVEYKYRAEERLLSAVIEIEDTGIGIPEKERDKI